MPPLQMVLPNFDPVLLEGLPDGGCHVRVLGVVPGRVEEGDLGPVELEQEAGHRLGDKAG